MFAHSSLSSFCRCLLFYETDKQSESVEKKLKNLLELNFVVAYFIHWLFRCRIVVYLLISLHVAKQFEIISVHISLALDSLTSPHIMNNKKKVAENEIRAVGERSQLKSCCF